ncbi:UNVERIFIED_CONTAM: PLP-dependent aminotransferase family protein [Streptococcus canis]
MTSKYQSIISDLDQAIQDRSLKKGERLPSIRQLSDIYHCSKDTVQRALLELKYRHLIYAVPKSGYYVLGKVTEEETSLDLSLEDYNNMAYEDFRLCLNETLVARESYLFHYYHKAEGLEELRDALLPYLADNSIYGNKEQLLITSGTQQALYILSQMSFPGSGQTILIEQPTYHRMETLLTNLGITYRTIHRDFNGLNLEELESLFKSGDIKFFYTISRFSNPLGLSYSAKEKEAIVRLAQQYQVYILEDDYLGDFVKSKETPLHYYDTHERVIYLKSFSMSVFPALRIGTLVLPSALKASFLTQKSMIDLDTNLLMQKALSLYLENGMFQKNLKHIKQLLKQREDSLVTFLNKYHPNLNYRLTPTHLIINCDKSILLPSSWSNPMINLVVTDKTRYLTIAITQDIQKTLALLFAH